MGDPEAVQPIVTIAEAQAFARVETGEEEALVAALIRSASALCESFLGKAVLARPLTEDLPAGREWQRLSTTPVRTIDTVELVAGGGPAQTLSPAAYAVDVDSSGDGWVRLTSSASGVLRVSGTAGLASSPNGVPEPIRHGVLRLVAHLFSVRDGEGGEIPAAVTALWRPYRRMRMS